MSVLLWGGPAYLSGKWRSVLKRSVLFTRVSIRRLVLSLPIICVVASMASCLETLSVWDPGLSMGLPPLHFPNPGRGSVGGAPSWHWSGCIAPRKLLEFYMRFGASWCTLVAVICMPRDPVHLYLCDKNWTDLPVTLSSWLYCSVGCT